MALIWQKVSLVLILLGTPATVHTLEIVTRDHAVNTLSPQEEEEKALWRFCDLFAVFSFSSQIDGEVEPG